MDQGQPGIRVNLFHRSPSLQHNDPELTEATAAGFTVSSVFLSAASNTLIFDDLRAGLPNQAIWHRAAYWLTAAAFPVDFELPLAAGYKSRPRCR